MFRVGGGHFGRLTGGRVCHRFADMVRDNRGIVLEYVEAFNRGDVDGVCRLFAPDALVYGGLGWGRIVQVRAVWKDLVECFRMNLHVESIAAEGDVVAVRYTERGTSLKSFRGGPPPTGKSYEVVAME
jgi:ketosteroid isomerase-like protein